MEVFRVTLPQLLRRPPGDTPTHTRGGDVMGVAEVVGEAPRDGGANTPSSALKVTPPIQGSNRLQLAPAEEGSGIMLGALKVKAVKLRL